MTRPEHYLAAERLQEHARALAAADKGHDPADTAGVQRRMAGLAEAQVYATLDLAAVLSWQHDTKGARNRSSC